MTMTTTALVAVRLRLSTGPARRPVATALALVLAAVASVASVVCLLRPAVLHGPAAMNGSARGTALVVLFAAVPVLVVSLLAARRRSALALLTWLGALGMLAYNALMFLFATPFNELFLLYVGWLGLTAWSLGLLLTSIDVQDLADRFAATSPRRAVAVYIWVVVGLNSLAWLAKVVPGLGQHGHPEFLRGTGLTTNVAFVQDLSWWLPLMAVVGVWLWQGRAWGLVLATGGLVMWVLESISVAVDQAYGAAADPSSPVASAALTPAFAVLALVGVAPIVLLLSGFDRDGLRVKALRLAPPPDRRTARAWTLAALTLAVGALAVWGGLALVIDGFGMPLAWLRGTPFTSWTWPGLALLVGVALPHLLVTVLVGTRSRWGRVAGLANGVLTVTWIAGQLVVLQHVFFLQPVIAAVGAVEIWLALSWQTAADNRTGGPHAVHQMVQGAPGH